MGQLIYGNTALTAQFDDRTLTHLQIVIGAKLRRHESFFFTWTNELEKGSGRDSVWIDGAITLRFMYSTNIRHAVNPEWLELLSKSSNSGSGLLLLPEPVEPGARTTDLPHRQ